MLPQRTWREAGPAKIPVQLGNVDEIGYLSPAAGPDTTASIPVHLISYSSLQAPRLVLGSPLSISRQLRLACNLKRPVQSRQTSSSRSNATAQQDSPSGIFLHLRTRDGSPPEMPVCLCSTSIRCLETGWHPNELFYHNLLRCACSSRFCPGSPCHECEASQHACISPQQRPTPHQRQISKLSRVTETAVASS